MWMRVKIYTVVALCIGAFSWMLWDILQRDAGRSANTDVLVMGTNAGFNPFEYKEGDKIVGFDVDLAREIARELGKQLEIEDMAFDGLLPALDSGQVDMVLAGMSVTPDREKNTLFSDSYYSASQRIVVKQDSPIHNKYQLEGKKIGVQLGTTGDTLARKIVNTQVVQFPTAPSVMTELHTGGVDAVILDDAPVQQYIVGFSDLHVLPGRLSDEDYAIAVKKDNKELHEKINAALAKIRDDGRYDAIFEKYFASDKQETEDTP